MKTTLNEDKNGSENTYKGDVILGELILGESSKAVMSSRTESLHESTVEYFHSFNGRN